MSAIDELILNASKYADMEFRLKLEELIRQGGADAVQQVLQLIADAALDWNVRINMVRVIGYLQNPFFLTTLKHLIEQEVNINLRKEAIIAVAKFNDQRALNILKGALNQIKGGFLYGAISQEISRIKEHNPLLAMIPRFQEGNKNPRVFRVTLDVLKKILNPADAVQFTAYLQSEDTFIADGAFDLLCHRGDETVREAVLDYFRRTRAGIACLREAACDPLYMLVSRLAVYLGNNHTLIPQLLPDIRELYLGCPDFRVREVLLSVFVQGRDSETQGFLEELYRQQDGVRQIIIERLATSPNGVDMLIRLFRQGGKLKPFIIQALLCTAAGSLFLRESYDTLTLEEKHLAFLGVNEMNYHFFKSFLLKALGSGEYLLKQLALEKIKQNADYDAKAVLFEPEQQRVFLQMGDSFVETISSLFPMRSLQELFAKTAAGQLMPKHVRQFLAKLDFFLASEPVLALRQAEIFYAFFDTVVKWNQRDLVLALLRLLKRLKTFDAAISDDFAKALKQIIAQRGKNITAEELSEIKRVRESYQDIAVETAKIGEGLEASNVFMNKEKPDFDQLEGIFLHYPLAAILRREALAAKIKDFLRQSDFRGFQTTINFLVKFPRFSFYLREEFSNSIPGSSTAFNIADFAARIPERLDFHMQFEDKTLLPMFQAQLEELLPEFPLRTDIPESPTAILLADSPAIKRLIAEDRLKTKKLFVVLKNLADFGQIKAFQPVTFPLPVNLFRIMRAVLRDFFT